MIDINLVFFLAWITTSFLSTSYLRDKTDWFRDFGTPKNLFLCFILFLIIHKIISELLDTQEISFLFFSIISFGMFLSSLILNKGKKKTKRNNIDIDEINRISSAAQIHNHDKNQS